RGLVVVAAERQVGAIVEARLEAVAPARRGTQPVSAAGVLETEELLVGGIVAAELLVEVQAVLAADRAAEANAHRMIIAGSGWRDRVVLHDAVVERGGEVVQQADRCRIESRRGNDVAGEGRAAQRIVDGDRHVAHGGGGEVAAAFGKRGHGRYLVARVAIVRCGDVQVHLPLVVGHELGDPQRSADVASDRFARRGGLRLALAVEREGRGVERGIGGGDGDRSLVSGLRPPAVADGSELAVERSASAASLCICAPAPTAARAAAASTTTAASTSATAAATSAGSCRSGTAPAGQSEAAAVVGAETAIGAGRAERVHPQRVGAEAAARHDAV